MKTDITTLLGIAFFTMIPFLSGCGSSDMTRREMEIVLGNGVKLGLVQIPNGLWISKYEITQGQWKAVMGENPSVIKADRFPVENVSWNDCQEFLKKVNALQIVKESGLTFRLPTETEWRYACRGSDSNGQGSYCLLADGTEISIETLGQAAWFDLDGINHGDGYEKIVGQKTPNAFGLYDMHGNVWELTSRTNADLCIICGGCFSNAPSACSIGSDESVRWILFDHKGRDIGFRIVGN